MSYQVLARKWRPKNFHQLVGQDHVRKALVNALDTDRLHHAYLFTGTRGVGKTTLARILAKCLNCEEGISSEPCGVCSSCQEIDAGRFVDLIEVDAASRTKVEDTRELLDNVQYSPTRGRFKVYLIDEVHMLSSHSFNALLKTLEEPPPHVKFLLATTDPQKLPMTVLSRCLQFQLKNMPPERVVEHLRYLLGEEGVSYDDAALWLLGRAADGSMRDALSLTDQAIAFGQGQLITDQVASMLGVLDHRHLLDLLRALVAHDARQLMAVVAGLAEQAPDFAAVLQDLATLLHRLTLAQVVPEALPPDQADRDELVQLAATLPAEEVQLFYQLAIEGRRDLPLAPDPRTGLEMTLLRMLAFRPQGIPELPDHDLMTGTTHSPKPSAPEPSAADFAWAKLAVVDEMPVQGPMRAAMQVSEPAPAIQPVETQSAEIQSVAIQPAQVPMAAVVEEAVSEPVIAEPVIAAPVVVESVVTEPVVAEPVMAESAVESPGAAAWVLDSNTLLDNEGWLQLFSQLDLHGWAASQARNLCLLGQEGSTLFFAAPAQALAFISDDTRRQLQQRLQQLLQQPLTLQFEARDPLPLDNVSARRVKIREQQHQQAIVALQQHPHVQVLQQTFQAELDTGSVVPAVWMQDNTLH
ncbi:DNA polymerase III subunit gamma/tau [Marinospirillum alkaliphilum]|uniref:DNA polymerase III subunit gamma/tau n=1 Tax=Marinospirillum alkaliphilum DSM 21637 TaxID=1122209 RepID=A0A1K1TX91_9GAMM|nr:DNA polymerase III subunit gamma/tau [Marinospirillum alkaliphilum]SFX05198.1 DNA polymerase-3 subunit gamma/tau [Marinospirillum alkaliphilum DSM 21637]